MAQQAWREAEMAITAEEIRGGVACPTAEGAVPLRWLWVDLLGEQVRHNLEVTRALGRAIAWEHVLQAHADLFRASFECWRRLGSGCLKIVQSTATLPGGVQLDVRAD
jgi:hypothetical protein